MADTNTPLNIRFLKGTQANLDAIKNDSTKSFTPGAFYLTEDSERLYYAKDTKDIAYLNKYITTVNAVSNLPATANIGDFYYIKDGNILCFYNGGTGEDDNDTISKWTQVNVDTQDTNTSVHSLDISDGVVNSNKDAIKFSVVLTEEDKLGKAYNEENQLIKDSFSISKAAINDLVTQQTVDVTVVGDKTDNTDKKATIKTKLSGSDSEDSFSIEAGLNVGIEVTDSPSSAIGNIKINATDTKYSLDKPAGSTNIKFYEDGDEIEDIEFIAATNTSSTTENTDIVVEGVNEDQISIAHKLYSSPAGSGVTDKTVGREDNFTVLKGVTVSNGHVTGFETATITLDIPQDTNTYVTDIDVDGGTITLTRNDGSNDNLVAENKLYYTINNKTYYNQADLTSALQTYIENNLSKITNVMTFKGNTSATPTLTDCSLGDVYIVTANEITVNSTEKAYKGDMIIAYGTEDSTTGKLNSNGAKWIVVDGTEENTTYTLTASNDKITLPASTDAGAAADNRTITLFGDKHKTNTSPTQDVISVTGNNNNLTVTHGNYTARNIAATATNNTTLTHTTGDKTFKAITGFTSDSKGHVTGVTSTTYTLPQLPDQTNNHHFTTNSEDKKIILNNADDQAQDSVQFVAGTALSVAVATENNQDKVTYSHGNLTCNITDSTSSTTDITGSDKEQIVITDLTVNAQGHVSGYTKKKIKSTDTKYTFSGAAVAEVGNGVSITDTLTGTDGETGGTSAFTITSSNSTNLTVSKGTGTNEVSLGLIWGTF